MSAGFKNDRNIDLLYNSNLWVDVTNERYYPASMFLLKHDEVRKNTCLENCWNSGLKVGQFYV